MCMCVLIFAFGIQSAGKVRAMLYQVMITTHSINLYYDSTWRDWQAMQFFFTKKEQRLVSNNQRTSVLPIITYSYYAKNYIN